MLTTPTRSKDINIRGYKFCCACLVSEKRKYTRYKVVCAAAWVQMFYGLAQVIFDSNQWCNVHMTDYAGMWKSVTDMPEEVSQGQNLHLDPMR